MQQAIGTGSMSLDAVKNGWLTTALLAVLIYGINIFAEVAKDEQTWIYGVLALSLIATAALYAFVWKWTTVRTWTFYLVVIPLFITSSYDVVVTFDTWMMPNAVFMKQYLLAHDPHLHSIVVTMFVFLDGTILQAINLTAIYRLSNGLSARSLLLVPTMSLAFIISAYAFCALTSGIPLHPLTISFTPFALPYVVLFPLGILKIPRNFTLSQQKSLGSHTQSPFAIITSILLLAAAFVIIAKALVLLGVRNELLEIVRLNDPLIFLNDVEKNIPFIAVVIWQYVLVSLPLLAISVLHNFQSTKTTFLWEVAVVNFAFLLTGQFIFIGGSFFWRTPANLRVSPTNAIFWIINLLPVIACLAQVVILLPYRSSPATAKANSNKKRS